MAAAGLSATVLPKPLCQLKQEPLPKAPVNAIREGSPAPLAGISAPCTAPAPQHPHFALLLEVPTPIPGNRPSSSLFIFLAFLRAGSHPPGSAAARSGFPHSLMGLLPARLCCSLCALVSAQVPGVSQSKSPEGLSPASPQNPTASTLLPTVALWSCLV